MFRAEYRITLWQAVLGLLLGVSLLSLDGYLLLQNYRLKNPAERKSALEVGVTLLPIDGHDSDGKDLRLESGKETLLFVFSPVCKFCHQNSHSWNQIIAAAPFDNSRLLGVSIGLPGVDFVEKYGWNDRLKYADIPIELAVNNLRFNSTPLTILLDEDGRAKRIWPGVLSESSLSEILAELRSGTD